MLTVAAELILEVGLKEGQKAAANFAAKAATVVGAGILATGASYLLEEQRVPLEDIPKEDRKANKDGRVIRDLLLKGSFGAIGVLCFDLMKEAIEASDII
jgi:hypothetical protein